MFPYIFHYITLNFLNLYFSEQQAKNLFETRDKYYCDWCHIHHIYSLHKHFWSFLQVKCILHEQVLIFYQLEFYYLRCVHQKTMMDLKNKYVYSWLILCGIYIKTYYRFYCQCSRNVFQPSQTYFFPFGQTWSCLWLITEHYGEPDIGSEQEKH